jgi:DNA topoisomerase-1
LSRSHIPQRNNVNITDLTLCDFRPMYEHFEAEKAKKNSRTSADRVAAKAARDALEAPFVWCTLDGQKVEVGNFRVEPPGLFRGRGEHPRTGSLKVRSWPVPAAAVT